MTSRRRLMAPAASEDELVAELWRRGASGFQVGGFQVGGFEPGGFETEDFSDGGFAEITVYLPADAGQLASIETLDLSAFGARWLEDAETLEARDWLAEYRRTSQPFEVGHRFLVDPRDAPRDAGEAESLRSADDIAADGRIELRVPAQVAFGTGSHESTRLAIEWLEAIEVTGLEVLDAGTGSGILAFAAERQGAARVVGFDIDPPSVIIAAANARLNDCWPLLVASSIEAVAARSAFDLAMVNVLPERVLASYPRLLRTLRPGGWVISSGNLTERTNELLARFADLGLEPIGERRAGEWSAWLLRLETKA